MDAFVPNIKYGLTRITLVGLMFYGKYKAQKIGNHNKCSFPTFSV